VGNGKYGKGVKIFVSERPELWIINSWVFNFGKKYNFLKLERFLA
jgi:hypothetical protein